MPCAGVDVHEKVRHVIAMCGEELAAKGLALTTDLSAGMHQVRADPARFQQIVWNLVKNAVKFTPVSGAIQVRTHNPVPGRIAIEIRDSGIGIAPDALPRIFDAFEQGGREVTRQFGGLGLAISRALAEMHGGVIRADSQGSGRGATFTVELPAARLSGVPLHPRRAAGPGLDCAVLLVEDHADTRRIMSKLLVGLGCRVQSAGTVTEALKLADEHRFDLLISDIGLPDATGMDLMRQIKATHGIRGIAVSGYGMDEDIRNSTAAGFDAHLTKPVDLRTLEEMVRRLAT